MKKLASQWKPLARFVIIARSIVTHPLLAFLTIIGLVTVVVTVVVTGDVTVEVMVDVTVVVVVDVAVKVVVLVTVEVMVTVGGGKVAVVVVVVDVEQDTVKLAYGYHS